MKTIIFIGLFATNAFAHPGPHHHDHHPDHHHHQPHGGVTVNIDVGELIDDLVDVEKKVGEVSLLDYRGESDRGEDYDADAAFVSMNPCGFEKVFLTAENRDAKIKIVRVIYRHGAPSEYRLADERLSVGKKSREFKLRENGQGAGDDDRCIEKVVVVGETLNVGEDNDWRDQAKINIFGVK